MKFNIVYFIKTADSQIAIPNKTNPIAAKNIKELLPAIAANIQYGTELELPIVGIHITLAE